MSLLTICQNVCAELSLDQPISVMDNTDATIVQLQKLIQREGDELARVYDWSSLVVQRTFTSVSTQAQTEPPADWERFYNNSDIWNRSRLWKLNGPVQPMEWQRVTVYNSNPVPQIWRIIGGKINIYPPVAGETLSYEYITGNWIQPVSGSNKATYTADTDIAIVPERIMELGVIWRWKRAKGFDYGEEKAFYEDSRASEIGSDRAKGPWSLSVPYRGDLPDNYWSGIITP